MTYEQRAMVLPATKRQMKRNHDHRVTLSNADFWHLPLWFEERCNSQDGHQTDDLKELVFQLFATASDSNRSDEGHVDLLPMLLVWCTHPSCSFSDRHQLEEFAPRYPRGLFRAFQLLRQHCDANSNAPQCISSLLAVAGTSTPEAQQQLLANHLSVSSPLASPRSARNVPPSSSASSCSRTRWRL